jgi:hypothetical protein
MKVSFYNAAPGGPLCTPVPAPVSKWFIHVSRVHALPRVDETVIIAGVTWTVYEVVHLVGPGDDYEARVWLRH